MDHSWLRGLFRDPGNEQTFNEWPVSRWISVRECRCPLQAPGAQTVKINYQNSNWLVAWCLILNGPEWAITGIQECRSNFFILRPAWGCTFGSGRTQRIRCAVNLSVHLRFPRGCYPWAKTKIPKFEGIGPTYNQSEERRDTSVVMPQWRSQMVFLCTGTVSNRMRWTVVIGPSRAPVCRSGWMGWGPEAYAREN